MVFPSIREPLGNVIIESGFCEKAVIASDVDGIPDIIENGHNGILLSPKNNLIYKNTPKSAVPIPDYVVNPRTKKLSKPKEIDKIDLINSIKLLKRDKTKRIDMGKKLYHTVKNYFSLEKYCKELNNTYKNILNEN